MAEKIEKEAEFKELIGKTILDIEGLEKGSDEVVFVCSDGSKYKMYHYQNCCESVEVEEVIGDKDDLIGSEIIIAEENTNAEGPRLEEYDDSYTWTFYKLATKKGYVDIRWYGSSNGYYAEDVDFVKIAEETQNKVRINAELPETHKKVIAVSLLVDNAVSVTCLFLEQEAIEKMAKAICVKKHCKDVCNKCEVWLHFKDCSEAALNALLGKE